MARESILRAGSRLALLTVLMLVAVGSQALFCAVPAVAQGWQWPWESDAPRPAPRPSTPVYRDPPPPQPGGPPNGQPYSDNRGGPPGRSGGICLQLEQRLAQEANRGGQARSALPEIEASIRETSQQVRSGESQLERQGCFEYFLFARSLRQTRACVGLNNQVEQSKRTLANLDVRRQQIMSSGDRSFRADIVRELARNNCGDAYVREARQSGNPFSSLWQDEGPVEGGNKFGGLPFATYRTVCVRLCDGYFFPVSFSTLPNHFDRDAEVCQSKCAAPSELYYHQNPGEGMDQAVSYTTKQSYKALSTAFRYRKEFIAGCSCKSAEYIPGGPDKAAPGGKRAEAPAYGRPAPGLQSPR